MVVESRDAPTFSGAPDLIIVYNLYTCSSNTKKNTDSEKRRKCKKKKRRTFPCIPVEICVVPPRLRSPSLSKSQIRFSQKSATPIAACVCGPCGPPPPMKPGGVPRISPGPLTTTERHSWWLLGLCVSATAVMIGGNFGGLSLSQPSGEVIESSFYLASVRRRKWTGWRGGRSGWWRKRRTSSEGRRRTRSAASKKERARHAPPPSPPQFSPFLDSLERVPR